MEEKRLNPVENTAIRSDKADQEEQAQRLVLRKLEEVTTTRILTDPTRPQHL
jgi:hypothetical protein